MPQSQQDLEQWLAKVRQVKDRTELFTLLDQFRPLDWTDEQRSLMAKTYIRAMDALGGSSSEAAANQKEKPDGPVWYEKM